MKDRTAAVLAPGKPAVLSGAYTFNHSHYCVHVQSLSLLRPLSNWNESHLFVATCTCHTESKDRVFDVIIVGGGFAGLGAAETFEDHNALSRAAPGNQIKWCLLEAHELYVNRTMFLISWWNSLFQRSSRDYTRS